MPRDALVLTGVCSILPPISHVCTLASLHNLCLILSFASTLNALERRGHNKIHVYEGLNSAFCMAE